MKYDFDELSGRVIAAAIEVHRALGPGFLESIYEQALKIELESRGMTVETQKRVLVGYHGQVVGEHVLDMVVDHTLIVELKACQCLEDVHYAQLKSYLKATKLSVGLLMNFSKTKLMTKRVVRAFGEEREA